MHRESISEIECTVCAGAILGSVGGLRDDALMKGLRRPVVDVDAVLHMRQCGLEPVDLSLGLGRRAAAP